MLMLMESFNLCQLILHSKCYFQCRTVLTELYIIIYNCTVVCLHARRDQQLRLIWMMLMAMMVLLRLLHKVAQVSEHYIVLLCVMQPWKTASCLA